MAVLTDYKVTRTGESVDNLNVWSGKYNSLIDALGTYVYYVDATEADQGVVTTTGDKTVKDFVTAIGTSLNATIFFPHNSGENTTTYTLTTSLDLSTYSNITFVFQKGAIIDGVGTLTIYSPANIIAQPNQQIFGSSITVSFTVGGEGYVNWWIDGGAGTTASPWTCSADNMAGLKQAIDAGLTKIKAVAGEYSWTTTYTWSTAGLIFQGEGLVNTIFNYTTITGDILTITATNADLRDFWIKGPAAKAGDEQALVLGSGATGSRHYLDRVGVSQVGGAAMEIDSFWVYVKSCFFYDSADDLIRLNDSGGTISIGGGTVITGAVDKAINAIGPSLNVHIYDTNIESSGYGIYGAGSSESIRHLLLSNVHFEANTTADIRGGSGLTTATATNCRFGAAGLDPAIDLSAATSCHFTLDGGRFSGTETSQIDASGVAHLTVLSRPMGTDLSKWTRGDANLSVAKKWVDQIISDVSTSGTGEDDLAIVTLEQNAHNLHRIIRVRASGIKTGGNGNKTIKFYVGSTAITFNDAANDTNDWQLDAIITLESGTAQTLNWVGWNGATPLQGYDTAAENFTTGTVTLKVTGECADAGDSITQKNFIVEME